MGTPEQNLINAVKKGFKKQRILMQRLEVMCGVGVPDCCYHTEGQAGSGFIEFKRIPEWPKRPETIVRIKHFTNEQRGWMLLHGPFVQRVFLLLQVSRTYMLFPWTSIKVIGELNRVDLVSLAEDEGGSWSNTIDYYDLKLLLRRNHVSKNRSLK